METSLIEIEKNVHLERLLSTDREMQQRLKKAVRKLIARARSNVAKDAKSGLGMDSDPRHAYKAVKSAVYKQILGGNISLLNRRKASSKMYSTDPAPDRTGKRGGNRMPRGKRTEQLLSYYGEDRGFILRFLNQGTTSRTDKKRSGNRGSIRGRNWFRPKATDEIVKALVQLEKDIDEAIKEANI